MRKQLTDFLTYVDTKTTFFEDKDVTINQVVDSYLAIHRTEKGQAIYDKIYDLLEARLNEPGLIRAADAWTLCAGHAGYNSVVNIFRQIITTMVEQGKAQKGTKHGTYIILKPNSKR